MNHMYNNFLHESIIREKSLYSELPALIITYQNFLAFGNKFRM